MKKLLALIFVLMLVSLVACKKGAMEKKTEDLAANEPVVASVGNDINTVDSEEDDLTAEELEDLDSGFSEVENI